MNMNAVVDWNVAASLRVRIKKECRKSCRAIFCIAVLSLVGACRTDHYEDASFEAPYQDQIGEAFYNVRVLQFYGVLRDITDRSSVAFYIIDIFPGTTGPEIVTSTVLQPETLFEISRVERCTSCKKPNAVLLLDVDIPGLVQGVPIHVTPELTDFDEARKMRLLKPEFFRPAI